MKKGSTMICRGFFLWSYFFVLVIRLVAFDNSTKIAADGAWCWFSDPRVICYKDKIYTGWVTSDGSIIAACYDVATHEIQTNVLHKSLDIDDHVNPSVMRLPDGRLLFFYSRHADKDGIRIRKSVYPEDISVFEPEVVLKLNTGRDFKGYCYTNPVLLQAENNRLYLCWRGLYWKPNIAWSDDYGQSWNEGRVLISSLQGDKNNRPYLKLATNNMDTIHFAFTDGHPVNEPTNSIYYMKYRNGEFFKADDTKIASMNDLPISHRKCDIVFDGRISGQRAWVWDVAYDYQEYPVIVLALFDTVERHFYYYARWNGEGWESYKVTLSGRWFPQTLAGAVEREPFYSGGIVLDHDDP